MDQKTKNNHTNSHTSTITVASISNRSLDNTSLDIIQGNLQHSITGSAALRRTLEMQPNTIALVQEPYLCRGKVTDFRALKGQVFTPPLNSKTRTFIYIPRLYKASMITHLCTDDLTVVKLETGLQGIYKNVVLASAYMDIMREAPPAEVEELMRFCENNSLECVLSCDSNAHCTVWGCPDTNERGDDFLDFILRYNMTLLNRGSEPTYVTSKARTIIDLTLATKSVATIISNWRVAINETSGADHRRIRYNLKIGIHEPRSYRNPKKTDKTIFRESLETALANIPKANEISELTPQDIEMTTETLTRTLKESFEKACPLKKEKYNITEKKERWWNKELTKLRKKSRHHFNRAMNTNDPDDWQEYRKTRHQLKTKIKQSKKNAWKMYSNSIQSESETARLRKVITRDSQAKLGSLKKADGTYTISEEEQCELLLQTHFPNCRKDDGGRWEPDTLHQPNDEDWKYADTIVTIESLLWAVSTFQPYKAPGMDEIFPALLQWNLNKIKTHLKAIFRSCLAWKYIPKSWREVKVVFLPKPGKTDYTNPKSFRPISLTSFLLKTLERLCDKYIRGGPLSANPIHRNQHAYQPGKSTESALHQVVCKIESAIESKQSCLATFIDVEGAFDKTTFHSIEEGLNRHKVDKRVNDWIKTMLSKRAASIETTNNARCLVTRGCPQGGVLSPLLWVVVVNELIVLLNKEGITTVGYADDLAILVSGLFETTLCEKMQKALKVVEQWCERHSLSVNPQKTELVLFTKKTKPMKLKSLTLFGTQLTLTKEVKYLGVWLDSKLLWGKHLDHIITKATNILWQCTRAVGKDWGLKPKLCRWLYTVIVRPILTYGCVVWWPRTNLVTTITRLGKVQRLACTLISGCMKKTPNAALDVILGLPPLHLHIQQEAMAAAIRLKSTKEWKTTGPTTSHCKIIDKAIKVIPEAGKGTDKIASTHLDNKKYELVTEEKNNEVIIPSWNIYTDGAKNETGTGCGFYSPELGLRESKTLNKTSTVLQAEAMGLLLAAKAVAPLSELLSRNDKDDNRTLMFHTDSAATIYALRRPVSRSRVIVELHSILQQLSESCRIIVRWIKSHRMCSGNTIADTLAKEGIRKDLDDEVANLCKPTTAEVREHLCRYTVKEHQTLWDNRKKDCKLAKAIFPKIDKKTTNILLKLKRKDLRLLVGLITGHCNLNYHLFKMGATDSPLCRGCLEENETVEHVLLHCPATEDIRIKTGIKEEPRTVTQQLDSIQSTSLSLSHSSSHVSPYTALKQLIQRPRAITRYFAELRWIE